MITNGTSAIPVVWDNGLFHTAGDYDKALHRRLIWRCSIAAA